MNGKTGHVFVIMAALAMLLALPTCAQSTPVGEEVCECDQNTAADEATQEAAEPEATPAEQAPESNESSVLATEESTKPDESTVPPPEGDQAATEPAAPHEKPKQESSETDASSDDSTGVSEEVMTLDQILDNMEAVRKKLKTFRADVIKAELTEILKKVERSKGTLQFKTPRLLRMELKTVPKGKETITVVGEEYAWVYRIYKQQATRFTLKDFEKQSKDANPLEYGLARDIHDLRKAYTLRLLPPEKLGKVDTLPIELMPIGARHATDGKLIFWIDKKLWLPLQVREYKSSGETVETHTFSNIKLNERMKDKVFKFKPPKDVEQFIN